MSSEFYSCETFYMFPFSVTQFLVHFNRFSNYLIEVDDTIFKQFSAEYTY